MNAQTDAEDLKRYREQEAANAAAQKKADEEARRQQQQGWFSWIFDTVKDNFWSMLFVIIGVVVATQVWGADKIKDMFEKGKDLLADAAAQYLPESWQPFLQSMLGGDLGNIITEKADKDLPGLRTMLTEDGGIPKGVVDVIAPDAATIKRLVQVVREANKTEAKDGKPAKLGKVDADSFTNDKTLFALMTTDAALTQRIAKAALGDAQTAKSDGSKKILASLRAIVADERLDVLLTKHQDSTIALIKTIKPEITDKQIAFLKSGVTDNKALPELRELLTAMLTPTADGKLPTAAELEDKSEALAKATPTTMGAAIAMMKEKDPKLAALLDNNGGKAYAALEAYLGGDKQAQAFMKDYDKQTTDGQKLAFGIKNRDAIEAYMAAADTKTLPKEFLAAVEALRAVPKEASETVAAVAAKPGVDINALKTLVRLDKSGHIDTTHLINELLTSPTQRQSITNAGAKEVIAITQAFAKTNKITLPAILNEANLTAVVTAADAVGKTLPPATSPADMAQLSVDEQVAARKNNETHTKTLAAIQAFTNGLLTENMRAVTPEQIAILLGNDTNNSAIYTMLGNLKGLSAQQTALLSAFVEPANQQLVKTLASDPKGEGPKLIQENLQSLFDKPSADSCKKTTPKGLDTSDKLVLKFRSWLPGEDPIAVAQVDGIDKLLKDVSTAHITACAELKNAAATPAPSPVPAPVPARAASAAK